MKVDAPLYGWVTASMLGAYGEPVELRRFIHPRAEPEIAFLLGRDVTTPATTVSVLAATEAVFAAIDILDSRYEDFRFTLPDVIADNASAGLFLLGRRPYAPPTPTTCHCSAACCGWTVNWWTRRPAGRAWATRPPRSPGWRTGWPSATRR